MSATLDSGASFAALAERVRATVRAVGESDPNPTDPYRGLYVSDEMALTLGGDQPPLGLEERFDRLCRLLALDPLERAVLGLCAAPEIHPDFARMYGYLHDDLTRSHTTPRLVARLLSGTGVSNVDVLVCFDRAARLSRTGALRLTGEGPLADRQVTVGGLLVCQLIGVRLVDDDCGGLLRRIEPPVLPLGRSEAVARLAGLLASDHLLPIAVTGPDATLAVCVAAGRGAVSLEARAIAYEDACADLALCCALEDRIAVIDHIDELPPDDARRLLDRAWTLPHQTVLRADGGRDLLERAAHVVDLPVLTVAERAEAWSAAAGVDELGELPARFRIDAGQISDAVELARTETTLHGHEQAVEQLWVGARAVSSGRLGELARRLHPGPTWDDLILPPRPTIALHAMASFLRNRERVLAEWGYHRIAGDRGLTALFAGESGTGKTLAARVIAHEAGLDVFRIDLAALFSKWVGETEKNLDRVFSAGENASAVLFFDEADVVFGKRTESSDSSDRYANLETAFLLQRIEAYDGIVVLATNLRANMDDAFVRRLDVVVDFPPPDASTRRQLWQILLPDSAPYGDDLDLDFLAERFELSGGGIRNCSLAAALLAADEDEPIRMRHLVRAVAMEFGKLGRLTIEADFGTFHGVVSNDRRR